MALPLLRSHIGRRPPDRWLVLESAVVRREICQNLSVTDLGVPALCRHADQEIGSFDVLVDHLILMTCCRALRLP